MIEEFERLRTLCRTSHHCSHYSSQLHDFDLVNELGERSEEVERALGAHPFGKWPRVIRAYSRNCPVAATWFSDYENVMRDYLDKYKLRILGIAPIIKTENSNKEYFTAIFLGNSTSENIECQNRNCSETACQYSFEIDIHAKALHVPQNQSLKK